LTSTIVQYEKSDILKAVITFSYDRYIAGKFDSYSIHRGTDNNKESGSESSKRARTSGNDEILFRENNESINSSTPDERFVNVDSFLPEQSNFGTRQPGGIA